MINIRISPSISYITGNQSILEEIHEHFSFKDKAAEAALHRFKKGLKFKEMNFRGDGEAPSWYEPWKESKLKELRDAIHVHCGSLSADSLEIPTGLVSQLKTLLSEKSIEFNIKDDRDFDIGRRLLTGQKPSKLRKPQEEALKAILNPNRPESDKGLGLVKIATGVGKTSLATELIREVGVKTVFLVPSKAIMLQTLKRFEEAFGKKNVGQYGGGKKDLKYVTVCTYQSVNLAEPGTFDEFSMAVYDECHHVPADTFFNAAQGHLKNCLWRIGLTAYEERADNSTMLVHSACGDIVYDYDVKQAIEDGYLAKPTFAVYSVERTKGEWTKYSTKDGKREKTGVSPCIEYDNDDSIKAYRNWVLGNEHVNYFVRALTHSFEQNGKSVLILIDEKEHGEKIIELLSEINAEVGFAFGGNKDNERLMKRFNARDLKILVATSVLSEGADTIPVDVLINLMGGASISGTLQAYGRALRNETDEDGIARKPNALIVDFDFPKCRMLNRHSKVRQQVALEMGEIHKLNLPM